MSEKLNEKLSKMKVPDIKIEPPGPKAREVIAGDQKYIMTSTKCSPIAVKRAQGAVVEDIDGNIYIDFTSGVAVANTGFCHPEVVQAIQTQAAVLMHYAGTDFYYSAQTDLAKRLTEITPGDFPKKVFFTNSGAESIEAAIKIAKWSTGKRQFIAFLGAFHGRSAGALALTASKPVHHNKFFPVMPGVTHIPFAYCYRCPYKQTYPECDLWCAKILEELYFERLLPPEEVAGIFMEPIQGEGGYIVPPPRFVPILKKIAEKHNMLLIDDEVQAGFGRTGKMFGIDHYGVAPDIMTLAKGMGSGMPIGATVFDAKLDFKVQGAHSNTYGGNLLACVSTLATMDVIEKEGLVERSRIKGEYMAKRLQELWEEYELIGDVRGLGLMQVTEFVKDCRTKEYAVDERDRIVVEAYKKGLILLPCGFSGIRYIPPLMIPDELLEKGLNIIEECIKLVSP